MLRFMRHSRVNERKLKNFKTLTELAVMYGVTRQAMHVRLARRRIPYEEIGSGGKRTTTIVVHRRYWEEIGKGG